MTPERFDTIRRVLAQRQPDLTVITDEVHKGRNLSAIMRNCDAVGIDTMHCVIPKKGFRNFRGTDLGTHKWVNVTPYEEVLTPIVDLQAQGYQVVAAHLSVSAKDFRAIDYTQPTALLLGTEKEGVSAQALAAANVHAVIPMMGMVESYNVSVACSIILTEAQRQRSMAGMYAVLRLQPDIYEDRLFRWCQPVLAKYCDDNNLIFPALDHEGDIKNPAEWYASVRAGVAPLRS